MASTHEQAARQAFALSAQGGVSVVQTKQFWRSLSSAERLAARLQQ
jgi:hypothetical protein